MRKLLKFPWLIIGACMAITVFFGIQLKDIRIENTSRTFMPKDDASYQFMLDAEKTFGSMLGLGISLETKQNTILTPEYIQIIQRITDKIETVDYVENIDSLTNIDYICGEDGGLSAVSLLGKDGEYTGSEEDLRIIRRKIVDWQEMYNRVIVNDDFKATQMMITITASTEDGEELPASVQTEILKNIKDICESEIAGSDLEIRYFGDPVMSKDAKDFLMSDLVRLIPFVALIVLLSLYFSFHTWSGTLLPLITVLVSTVWSVGLLCLLKYSFTIIGSMIPVCLIACGSAYGIHVVTHYYIGLDALQGEITKEKHLDAIMFALKDVWVAVLLAAITTVAGFISNVTSPLRPLRSFSIFAAAGVAFALILSVTLIPAMLMVQPVKSVGKHWKNKNRITAKIRIRLERELARRSGRSLDEANGQTMYNLYHFFAGTKPRLIVFTLVMVILSAVGIKYLVVDTAMVNYFPSSSQFRKDLAYVDEYLAGSNSMYVVIQGKKKPAQAVAQEASSDTGDFDFSAENDASSDFDFSGADSAESTDGFDFSGADEGSSDFDFGSEDGFDFSSDTSSETGAVAENSAKAEVKERYSMTNPEILRAVDNMQEYLLSNHYEIGKIVSFTTFIKRMNQVMHVPSTDPSADGAGSVANSNTDVLFSTLNVQDILTLLGTAYAAAGGTTATVEQIVRELEREINFNGIAFYEIPYDTNKYEVSSREDLSDLVTQYLYLLSCDAIDRFTDNMTNPTAIRVQIQLRTHSTVDTGKLIDEIKAYADKYFPEGYEVIPTGTAQLEHRMSNLVINSQMISIVFSLIMVFIIIAFSFKAPLAGFVGALPLGLVIILNFMVMGFADIRLDLCTSIVSSIAIGVGIDYTIHFMETYQHERAKSKDLEEVTKNTFKSSGRGIVTNALAVGLGFLVLVFSKFIILRYIGILVAVVMFTSSLLAMTIIPGILNAFDPKFMWTKEERAAYRENINAEKSSKK